MNAPPVEILVWSQVILSLQLPFAMLPLVLFTDDKTMMGPFANRPWIRILLWPTTVILLILNLVVLGQTVGWIPGG